MQNDTLDLYCGNVLIFPNVAQIISIHANPVKLEKLLSLAWSGPNSGIRLHMIAKASLMLVRASKLTKLAMQLP